MILVTGATGNFGGSTAYYLRKKEIQFRAASIDDDALRKNFKDGTDLAVFNWDKPETFERLLEGISIAYVISPPFTTNFHEKLQSFIEASKNADVKHIVVTTALFAGHPESIFYKTEALVRNSGIDYTIIRPSFLFQNFVNYDLQSVQGGVILAPSKIGKASYVDVRNVGEASSVILQNPAAHQNKIYSITGGEALTHSQMAEIFSKQLLKQIVHISPSLEEYKKTLQSFNVPDFVSDFMAMLYSSVAQGQWADVTDDYNQLTGKTINTFENYVNENHKIFAESSK